MNFFLWNNFLGYFRSFKDICLIVKNIIFGYKTIKTRKIQKHFQNDELSEQLTHVSRLSGQWVLDLSNLKHCSFDMALFCYNWNMFICFLRYLTIASKKMALKENYFLCYLRLGLVQKLMTGFALRGLSQGQDSGEGHKLRFLSLSHIVALRGKSIPFLSL